MYEHHRLEEQLIEAQDTNKLLQDQLNAFDILRADLKQALQLGPSTTDQQLLTRIRSLFKQWDTFAA